MLTGSDLTLDDVARRRARRRAASSSTRPRSSAMAAARAVVDRVDRRRDARLRRHDRGRRAARCSRSSRPTAHDRLLVRQHRDRAGRARRRTRSSRATALRLANALARATTVARPELASHLVDGAQRRPAARDPHARLDRPERSRSDGRPRRRHPRRTSSSRGARRSRCSTRAPSRRRSRRSRSPTRSCCSTSLDHAGALDLEALGANRDCAAPGDRRRPSLSRACRPRSARLGALLEGSEVEARDLAGPAQLPHARAAERRRPRRVRLRRLASSRSSSTRRSRTRSSLVDEDRLISVGNFEIQPLATALDLARLALAPADLDRGRARRQAPAGTADRAHGGPRRPPRPGRERAQRATASRSRRFAVGGAAARPARLVRARLDDPGRGDRGPDDDGAARCAAARGDGRARRARRLDRADARRPGLRPPRRQARSRHRPRSATAVRRFVPFLAEGASLPDLEPLVEEIRSREDLRLTMAASTSTSTSGLGPSSRRSAQRTERSRSRRRRSCTCRRARRPSTSAITSSRLGSPLLDLHEIDTAVVSLQPTLGLDGARHRPSATPLVRRLGGRDPRARRRSSRPDRCRSQSAGRATASPASAWARPARRPRRAGADARRAAGTAASSSCIRSRGVRRPRRAGLVAGASSTTRARCSAPTSRWLGGAQERWPDVTVVFAILAGGGPFQLERLASRGVDVRSSLHRNVFFDTASYGRRALELCIETFGVEQLVFGRTPLWSTRRRRLRAVEAFGESVDRLIRQDNLIGLLAVNRHRDMARRDVSKLIATSRGRSCSSSRRRSEPSARSGKPTFATTWSIATTCRCTATRTSTSG